MARPRDELRVQRPNAMASFARQFGTTRVLGVSFGLTLIALVLLTVLFAFFIQSGMITSDPDSGGLLEGVMSLIATALFIGGGVFALFEYAQREQERAFSLHDELIRRLMSEEEMAARRWIIVHLGVLKIDATEEERTAWIQGVRDTLFSGSGDQEAEGRKHVKQVLNSFDYLGLTALKYWEMDEDLVRWLGPIVVKTWERIGPYVEEEARRRNEPHYYTWARRFGGQMVAWWYSQNHPPSVIVEKAL